ncbi:MAG TPA: acyltransferase family protein, partial [Polyangiaceae bacterium]|nr:acyltransferase family protein [Polyangiaceae bacterium]
SARRHAQWLLGLALVVACATRSVYVSNAAGQVAPFWGAFLDDRGGSQYPIFPNAAFALLGAGISPLFLRAEHRPRGRTLVVLGALLAAGLYFAFQHGIIPYERGLFWRTSPFLTLFRFGLVMLLLGLCECAPVRSAPGTERSDALPQPRRDSIVESLAQHSLIAYVAHLFLLYGSPLTPSLVKRFGLSLSLLECTVAWLLVMGMTVAITYAFQWLSRERVGTMRWLQAGLTVLSLVMLAR